MRDTSSADLRLRRRKLLDDPPSFERIMWGALMDGEADLHIFDVLNAYRKEKDLFKLAGVILQ